MPCGYGTLRTTGVRIRHQVSRRPAQKSPQIQNLTILIVQSHSVLNAPPSPQVLSGARENALAQSESILQSSWGGWENLEVLRSTGEGYRSVSEVCVWLPDQITFSWSRAPGDADWENLEMNLEAVIMWTGRCTWRPQSSEFGDAPGGRDRVELRDAVGRRNRASSEIHCGAKIMRTWRPWSVDFGDTLGGHYRVNSEMPLEAVIERVWRCTWRPRSSWTQRCTWRPWSSELGDALGGRDQVTLRITWKPWSSHFGDALGGRDQVELRDAHGGLNRAS